MSTPEEILHQGRLTNHSEPLNMRKI